MTLQYVNVPFHYCNDEFMNNLNVKLLNQKRYLKIDFGDYFENEEEMVDIWQNLEIRLGILLSI